MIPKGDGQQRPLAIAALEDKIVQKATLAVLNSIYEENFLGSATVFGQGETNTTRWMRWWWGSPVKSELHPGRRHPELLRLC